MELSRLTTLVPAPNVARIGTITAGCDTFWHKKSAIPNTMVSGFYYLHFDKLFIPDATQSQAPYSLLHSSIFQTH